MAADLESQSRSTIGQIFVLLGMSRILWFCCKGKWVSTALISQRVPDNNTVAGLHDVDRRRISNDALLSEHGIHSLVAGLPAPCEG